MVSVEAEEGAMNTKELIEQLRHCGEQGCAECPDIEICTGPGWLMLKAAELLEELRKGKYGVL